MEYGRNVIGNTGNPILVEVDARGEYPPIGISLDWGTVAALGSDATINPEGVALKSGQKYLPHGQVLTRITNTPVQTIAFTNVTGGTFALSGYRNDTGAYVNTGPLAWNISLANLAAAISAPSAFGVVPASITGTAGASYVITTPVALMSLDGTLLTGTSPVSTIALTTPFGNYGMYGPYDPAATDGRQTLTRGQCVILNSLITQNGVLGNITFLPSNHPGCVIGGLLWKARIKATVGTASLAAGPTFAALETAFPRVTYAGTFPSP